MWLAELRKLQDMLLTGEETIPGGKETIPGGKETIPGGKETIPGGKETIPGETKAKKTAEDRRFEEIVTLLMEEVML
ncbi:hypothetical protein, conserved [Eimeria praecox]|uniref:Uncharacterized protein n=1 Tax=Eimeria praecox TaxID=51316 RepID=U6H4K7_9EIME|nr:hypothetical protein, conserved [Eimeria praecox]